MAKARKVKGKKKAAVRKKKGSRKSGDSEW